MVVPRIFSNLFLSLPLSLSLSLYIYIYVCIYARTHLYILYRCMYVVLRVNVYDHKRIHMPVEFYEYTYI